MKLSTFILASALTMTISMQAMDEELPPAQTIPANMTIQQGLIVDRPDRNPLLTNKLANFKSQSNAMQTNIRCINCMVIFNWLFCCPCMTYKAIAEECCSK